MSHGTETWTEVHHTVGHGILGRFASKGRERHGLLRFNEASFVHEVDLDYVTAQHVSLRSRSLLKGFTGFWRRTSLQHHAFTTHEQVSLASLVSVVVAYRSSGFEDAEMYLEFADSLGGSLALPVAPAFERSTTWAPLLRDALSHAGVHVDEAARDVLDAWCTGRTFSRPAR